MSAARVCECVFLCRTGMRVPHARVCVCVCVCVCVSVANVGIPWMCVIATNVCTTYECDHAWYKCECLLILCHRRHRDTTYMVQM